MLVDKLRFLFREYEDCKQGIKTCNKIQLGCSTCLSDKERMDNIVDEISKVYSVIGEWKK